MKLKLASGIVCGLILAFAVIGTPSLKAQQKKKPGVYATFDTSEGTIVVELFEKEAPITVKNFTELAEGKKKYKDPRDGQEKTGHYYDGTIFHRVIPDFMIQGGDPTGTGTGDPGYKFQNESSPSNKFDKAGRLAMANAGRNTNGSQFFITEGPVPLSEQDYTIFGQVVDGLDVVKKIARVPKAPKDARNPEGSRPAKDVVLKKVTIERVPAGS
jgi:peptidyl-prolyl cis-trans isomerase A (cyclophilin A)